MSSGHTKQILRWNSLRQQWQGVWVHGLNGERRISKAFVKACKLCGKQELLGRHSRGCSSCCDKRRESRRAAELAITAASSKAHAAVHIAIRDGVLADLRHVETKCTDCTARAVVYDHRDYSMPLDVQPVCRSCNTCRGPAEDIAHLVTRRFKRRSINATHGETK